MTPENYEKLRQRIVDGCIELMEYDDLFCLSHVLRAIKHIYPSKIETDFGGLEYDSGAEKYERAAMRLIRIYDLKQDDLSLQSEETKMFLFNLLCENER